MTDRALGAALACLALGCATTTTTTTTTKDSGTAAIATAANEQTQTLRLPRLRIVDAKLGAERAARREPIVVPFGVNQNGTELIYVLLERAGEKKAAAVGDLTLYMTFRWRGAPVECRQRVLLDGDPRLSPTAATPLPAKSTRYDTDIEVYQPQAIDFIAEDRELVCKPVRVAVNKWRLLPNPSDRTAEATGLGDHSAGERELVTLFETHDECAWKPITRRTTRYDYQVKLGFVPPNWEQLSARFAKRKLVPAPAQCYTITDEALAEQPIYRLTAVAYHRGAVEQRQPRVLPSRTAVEAQFTPTGMMTPALCEKILNTGTGVKRRKIDEDDVIATCRPEEQLKRMREMRPVKMYDEDPVDLYAEDDETSKPFDAD